VNTCTSGTQTEEDRVISPYEYIRSRESFEKVGSVWVETGAAFDESDHSEVLGALGSLACIGLEVKSCKEILSAGRRRALS